MTMTAAERQRRCREKRKQNLAKYEEYKRKARERYHAKKRLVKDMSIREKRAVNRKWRLQKKKCREASKQLQNVIDETPPSYRYTVTRHHSDTLLSVKTVLTRKVR